MKPSDLLKNSSVEIKRIAYSHGFKNIRVFGSAINNTDHEGSDLDLLVEPSESTTLMTIGALRSEQLRSQAATQNIYRLAGQQLIARALSRREITGFEEFIRG
jgi:predicted nucleotidyltransferase